MKLNGCSRVVLAGAPRVPNAPGHRASLLCSFDNTLLLAVGLRLENLWLQQESRESRTLPSVRSGRTKLPLCAAPAAIRSTRNIYFSKHNKSTSHVKRPRKTLMKAWPVLSQGPVHVRRGWLDRRSALWARPEARLSIAGCHLHDAPLQRLVGLSRLHGRGLGAQVGTTQNDVPQDCQHFWQTTRDLAQAPADPKTILSSLPNTRQRQNPWSCLVDELLVQRRTLAAGPHCHRVSSGIQGMLNASLNQEVNAFMRSKNKLEVAQRSILVGVQDEEQRETLLLSFSTHGAIPGAMLRRRGGNKSPTQSESTNPRGKVTPLLGPAAAGQDSSWRAGTRSSIRPVKHWRPFRERGESEGKTWLVGRKFTLQPAQERNVSGTLRAGRTLRTARRESPAPVENKRKSRSEIQARNTQ